MKINWKELYEHERQKLRNLQMREKFGFEEEVEEWGEEQATAQKDKIKGYNANMEAVPKIPVAVEQKNTRMYTSYAKDIFMKIYETGDSAIDMDVAIALVKQVREAFK